MRGRGSRGIDPLCVSLALSFPLSTTGFTGSFFFFFFFLRFLLVPVLVLLVVRAKWGATGERPRAKSSEWNRRNLKNILNLITPASLGLSKSSGLPMAG